uniref:hypothetical protein n=1 Tax=Shewanella baltica TaxID=62322 RepID=UPI00404795BD
MTKLLELITPKDRVFNQAIVSVDADLDAERILILNRNSGYVYHNFKFEINKNMMFIVPNEHLVNSNILVGILDDDRTYNAKFVDGVQAELIDGNDNG